jgi:hypothetical protein
MMPDEKPTQPPPSLEQERERLEANLIRTRRYSPSRARKSADNLIAVAAAHPGWGK